MASFGVEEDEEEGGRVGEAYAEFQIARVEGTGIEIVQSVQNVRMAAAMSCASSVVKEMVSSCEEQAAQRLAELVETAAMKEEGNDDLGDAAAACAALRTERCLELGSEAFARGSRVYCRRLMRTARKKDEASSASLLGNILGACSVAAKRAMSIKDLLKNQEAALDCLGLGQAEVIPMLHSLSKTIPDSNAMPDLDQKLEDLAFGSQFARRFSAFSTDLFRIHEATESRLKKEVLSPDFSRALASLDATYVSLENRYCDLANAVAIKGLHEALESEKKDAFTQCEEALSDCFWVLRRGIDRSLSTLSEQAALARLHQTANALSSDLFLKVSQIATAPIFNEHRQETHDFAAALLSAVDDDEHGASASGLAGACSAALLCADSSKTLRDEVLVAQLAAVVPAALPLIDDFDKIVSDYEHLATGALDTLLEFPSFMTARSQYRDSQVPSLLADLALRSEAEARRRLGKTSASIDDNALTLCFQTYILGHAVLRDALNIFAQSSNPGRARALLAKSLAADATTAFLRGILSIQFTPFGALAAQTEARHLHAALSALLPAESDQSIRPLFEPLTVALALLNLETPADASAVPFSGLSSADLRLILSRRTDFTATAIQIAIDNTPHLLLSEEIEHNENTQKEPHELVYFQQFSSSSASSH